MCFITFNKCYIKTLWFKYKKNKLVLCETNKCSAGTQSISLITALWPKFCLCSVNFLNCLCFRVLCKDEKYKTQYVYIRENTTLYHVYLDNSRYCVISSLVTIYFPFLLYYMSQTLSSIFTFLIGWDYERVQYHLILRILWLWKYAISPQFTNMFIINVQEILNIRGYKN